MILGGFDTSVHISEEARNAPRAVPFAIVASTVVSATLGWSKYEGDRTLRITRLSFFIVVNIMLAFYMGNDLASITGNDIGQPMATVCHRTIESLVVHKPILF